MARVDYRQRLTDQLVKAIEEHGQLPWTKGWDRAALRPFNAKTGVKFKGGNVLNLLLAQLEQGSNDPRWMTLNQANKAGYRIRKGVHPIYVEYWDVGKPLVTPKVDEAASESVDGVREPEGSSDASVEQKVTRSRSRVFYAQVYNGADVVGLPPFERKCKWEPIELAARLLEASKAVIEHGALSKGSRSPSASTYYAPATDVITLPLREQFKSPADYYATAFYALAHWTGHVSRLGRDQPGVFGSVEYAKEELRAELASMFLCAALDLEGGVRNHALYTEAWLTKLKGDKQEMFRAARDAEKIVNYLFDLAPELLAEVDAYIAANVLPDSPGFKVIHSGVSKDLPNFVPAGIKPAVGAQTLVKPTGVGSDDPRWGLFEQALRGAAARQAVREETLQHALTMVAQSFTEAMDRAEDNGFDAVDMSKMLAGRVVVDMLNIDRRNSQWQDFSAKVHRIGDPHVAPEAITLALNEKHGRYLALLNESARQNWAADTAKLAIEQLVFGDSPRMINIDFVQKMVRECEASRVFLGSDVDDFILAVASVSDVLDGDREILQPVVDGEDLLVDADLPSA